MIMKFICPYCRREFSEEVKTVINAVKEPEAKHNLLNDSFFLVRCAHCGRDYEQERSFLYYDSEYRFAIKYATSEDDVRKGYEIFFDYDNELMQLFTEYRFKKRIVRSRKEFKEKLQIFYYGLDDRLIEFVKFSLLPAIRNKIPNSKIEVYYGINADRKEMLLIYADGNYYGMVDVTDRKEYNLQAEKRGSRLCAIENDGPVIDVEWAKVNY